jgi:hypothetical protein
VHQRIGAPGRLEHPGAGRRVAREHQRPAAAWRPGDVRAGDPPAVGQAHVVPGRQAHARRARRHAQPGEPAAVKVLGRRPLA